MSEESLHISSILRTLTVLVCTTALLPFTISSGDWKRTLGRSNTPYFLHKSHT
ncbi:hypothetical protein ASPBRDRAFT_42747 [Aspergillus brasiliensis CBS 101740]|uniref:Uncharacterized protein n=1 Tax=Aspergillus brasiliensis (strain CBS 101740 / IMI 381727 / IBT 21946) TaxID=767769 RepID=A0A1L9UMR8_ASPBC|nr:hypothetical protein ASPBRDRAFT_42747 [Aspergillus brasiliensis CBS 101740]